MQAKETQIKLLDSGHVVRRRLPVNLKPDDLPLFADDLERVIPPSHLLVMQDVFASSEGLLFKATKILPESFAAPFLFEKWKFRSRIKFLTRNHLLKRTRTLAEDAVWVVDDWSAGYYHWLADTLPRLYAVRERLRDLTLLLPHRVRELEFVRTSLEPFPLKRVDFVAPDEKVLCPRLIVPMHRAPSGQHNEEIIRALRCLMVDYFSKKRPSEAQARVYISRRRATRRRIANEPEVIEVLRDFGFEVMETESLTLAEQVRLLSSARHLISNHGAGLTNMMFMPPGANVLELRHSSADELTCYFNLASALGVNYFYQTCVTAGEDSHTSDLIVDKHTLKENVDLMLSFST